MALMFKATERRRLMWISVFTGAKIRKAIIRDSPDTIFCLRFALRAFLSFFGWMGMDGRAIHAQPQHGISGTR